MARKNKIEGIEELQKQPKTGGMSGPALGLYMLAFVSAVFMVPTLVLFVLVGLAPTMVSWLVNQHPNRGSHLLTVFSFNLSGVLPFLAPMWSKGKNFPALFDSLTDVYTYLAMYGAAAIALLVIMIAPQIAATFLQLQAREQLRRVGKTEALLVAEWGDAVTGVSAQGQDEDLT